VGPNFISQELLKERRKPGEAGERGRFESQTVDCCYLLPQRGAKLSGGSADGMAVRFIAEEMAFSIRAVDLQRLGHCKWKRGEALSPQ